MIHLKQKQLLGYPFPCCPLTLHGTRKLAIVMETLTDNILPLLSDGNSIANIPLTIPSAIFGFFFFFYGIDEGIFHY
jgi:hypothetical protein